MIVVIVCCAVLLVATGAMRRRPRDTDLAALGMVAPRASMGSFHAPEHSAKRVASR